ncbi:MAG: hypothetical protein RR595_07620 [Lysinibacillus sp.]
MRQCENCGKTASNSENFCLECGTKLTIPATEKRNSTENGPGADSQEQHTNTYFRQSNTKKEPMSTKKKVIIGSVFVLIALLLIGHFTIKSLVDPTKQIANLNKYYLDENYEKFTQSFHFPNETLVDNKAFFKYMKELDWTKNINPELEEKLDETITKGYSEPLTNEDNHKFITVKESKFLLFYKKYSFNVQPVEVSVSMPDHKAHFKIGELVDTEVSKETKKVGKLAPGIYTYSLALKDDYFENDIKKKLSITNTDNNKQAIEIDIADYQVHLTSDIEDAIVFINNKSTEKTASDVKLFAAKLDDSVKVHAMKTGQDGKEEKSEVITLNDSAHHLQFSSVQAHHKAEEKKKADDAATEDFLYDYEETARSLFYDFRSDYEYALESADFSYVQDYFSEGSQVRKDYSKFVTDHNQFDYYEYDFQSNMIDNVYAQDASTIILDSTEIFEFYLTEDGTWSYQREKRYTMKLSNDTLRITDIQDRSKVIKTKISD